MAAKRSHRDGTVAARVHIEDREALERVALVHDRTVSTEVGRAIRFYVNNFDLADRMLRERAAGQGN